MAEKKFDYGKYRGIIISIALFLVLDASVLIFNFYMSYQIASDAISVNIAGRQRMLSQRMTKSIFDIHSSLEDKSELERAVNELQASSLLFDTSFTAFNQGGFTTAPDGQQALLEKVVSLGSIEAINLAAPIWNNYYSSIKALLALDYSTQQQEYIEQLATTLAFARNNNLKLLKLMNDLTVDLESVARSKAERLRMIQTVGIILALINFFIIMFHSVKQLRASDYQIEAAQNETREILDTVNEGLFLLDPNGMIGEQYSAELEAIINKTEIGGHSIESLLRGIVSEKDMLTTQKYIGLLFDPSKKEKLLGSLNPLKEVEAHLGKGEASFQSKFLSFAFSRVLLHGEIRHILVTVKDITKQVLLAHDLDMVRKQSEQQLEMMTTLLSVDSKYLPSYLDNSTASLNTINNYLKEPAKSHVQLIDKANKIYREIHNFKGESSAIEMFQFADMAHQFENELSKIKSSDGISGNAFLPLTVMLKRMMAQVEAARTLISKISTLGFADNHHDNAATHSQTNWDHLQNLAEQVAERHGKKVEVIHSGLNDQIWPNEVTTLLNNISIQLIRNSVVHGIENADERLAANKDETGVIDIRLAKKNDGSCIYSFSDDGSGIDIAAIREAAIKQGVISEEQSELMDKKQIISLIFSADLSTSEEVDEDSGRGVGMASVQEAIRKLNGKLAIRSQVDRGCRFSIVFTPQQSEPMNQAAA